MVQWIAIMFLSSTAHNISISAVPGGDKLPRYQRKTNRNTFEYVSLPMVFPDQNQTVAILYCIL